MVLVYYKGYTFMSPVLTHKIFKTYVAGNFNSFSFWIILSDFRFELFKIKFCEDLFIWNLFLDSFRQKNE